MKGLIARKGQGQYGLYQFGADMVLTRFSRIGLVAAFLASPVHAECKPSADKYEIIDLGELVPDQLEARAVHIDSKGQSVVRSISEDGAADFSVSRKGKATALTFSADGAERQTLALLDNRVKLVDYTMRKPGYVDLKLTTLVGRRGNEVDVKDYCTAHSKGWVLDTFKISQSGNAAAALFVGADGYAIVECREDEAGVLLFSSPDQVTLDGINNDGDVAGLKDGESGSEVWRFSDGELESIEFPEDVLDAEVMNLADSGAVLISTIGAVTNSAFSYSTEGGFDQVEPLPGEGWDVDWVVQGPCGHMFGQATYTNFATYVSLSDDEKARLQENMSEFMSYAQEREDALFFWSPEAGGKFLQSVVGSIRDWQYLKINAVNSNGQAVGEATDENGVVRAVRLDPVK